MNIADVIERLAWMRWALDELPETANVLMADVDDSFGVRIQIESGSGFFEDGAAFETKHRTALEGYGVIERSRVIQNVFVHEIERA